VFVIAGLVAAAAIAQSEQDRRQRERALVSAHIKDHARFLESYLNRAMSASYALAALVEVGQGDIPDFDAVAARLLPLYPGASELLLAPDGVIRRIAPLSGNEKALGIDLLTYPGQKEEASLSRDSGQLTLAGRLPLSLQDASGQPKFWGFTEVVMRLPQALQPAQLADLTASGYRFQLWRRAPGRGIPQIIQASTDHPLIDPVEAIVHVPNGAWTLSADLARGWSDPAGLSLKAAVGLMLALLCSYLATLLVSQRTRSNELETLASQRTTDIRLAKDQLKSLLDAIPDLVWLKDVDGNYLCCNPQLARYFNAT